MGRGLYLLLFYWIGAFLTRGKLSSRKWHHRQLGILEHTDGVVAVSIYISFVKKPDAKSRFYGFSIAKIGAIYGLVQLVASLILKGSG